MRSIRLTRVVYRIDADGKMVYALASERDAYKIVKFYIALQRTVSSRRVLAMRMHPFTVDDKMARPTDMSWMSHWFMNKPISDR